MIGGLLVKLRLGFFKKKRVWIPLVVVVVIVAAGGGTLWGYHDNPKFCTMCHIMDPYLESWESPPLLANAHSEYDLACLDCHPFEIGQSVREIISFVFHNYEEPLTEQKFSKEWCFQCHEHGSYEELKQLVQYQVDTEIGDLHNSHLGGIDCRLCHKMHKPSVDYCSQCHGPIVDEEGWIPWEEASASP